jgi:hypothetical protein
MFAHVVAYFGIDYFDQIEFAWLAFLAIIPVAVFEAMRAPAPQAQEALAPSYAAPAAMDWDPMGSPR